jgi:hypothetical protein
MSSRPQFGVLILAPSMASLGWGQTKAESFHVAIAKTWDDGDPLHERVGPARLKKWTDLRFAR